MKTYPSVYELPLFTQVVDDFAPQRHSIIIEKTKYGVFLKAGKDYERFVSYSELVAMFLNKK